MNQTPAVEHVDLPFAPSDDFVAWTAGGDLALVDGATGAIRQNVGAEGGAIERDLAWDPWGDRVIAYEGGEDDSGEITVYPIRRVKQSVELGARSHLAWVDGRARLLPTPHGAVVFEEGYGVRWKLLGGLPTASVIAPPPASAWLTVDDEGATIHSFGYADGALERCAAAVGVGGIADPSVQPLDVTAATLPPSARLVPAPAPGDALLVDVSGGSLVVRLVSGGAAGPASLVPLPAAGMRVEAAVPLRGGRLVAVLLSGDAAAVAVAAVDPGGVVSGAAHLVLPGEVVAAPRFFARVLAALGDSDVLAATSAGVHAVRVTDGATGVHLALAPGFAGSELRGPIAALDPAP